MRAAVSSTVHVDSNAATLRARLPGILVALWACLLISVPIIRWTLGDATLPFVASATVIALAAAMFLLLVDALGFRSGAITAGIIVAAAWGVEFVGSKSALPFGAYHYTDALQPQVGGVPVIIPLAWLMMLPPAWAVGAAVAGRHRGPIYIVVAALAFAAWDLYLDPQMVAWGFWRWDQPGGYFGIPWQNFAGWFICAAVITWIAGRVGLPPRLPLTVYALTWILQAIGLGLFWRMPGPALCGFGGMGILLTLGYTKQSR